MIKYKINDLGRWLGFKFYNYNVHQLKRNKLTKYIF